MTNRAGILKNSPLIYTLASVRFAEWSLMAKKIDEIHEDLRELTPFIHRIEIQQIGPEKREEPLMLAWMMLSKDRSTGIQLSGDQVLIFIRNYTRYHEFAETLEKVLDVLFKHMRFMDVTNIGVRYIDLIKVNEGEEFDKYVTPKLLPADLAGFKTTGGVSLTTYKLDDAELRVRCISQPNELSVPADLIQLLAIAQGPGQTLSIESLGSNKFILDMDALKLYPEAQRESSKKGILDALDALHNKANQFFRHQDVCTEDAFKAWKGEA